MRLIFFILLLTSFTGSGIAQGKLLSKELQPKAGSTNIFIYQPPANLFIPQKMEAIVVYQTKGEFISKTIAMSKTAGKYQFQIRTPDSTSVLIVSIVDGNKKLQDKNSFVMERKKVIDNNNENGFVIYLHDKKGKRFNNEKIALAGLLEQFAKYVLELKPIANTLLIKMYEDTYKSHPEYKLEDSYVEYLKILYKENESTAKPTLISYANQMFGTDNDESKLANAANVFRLLRMDEFQSEIEEKILAIFPDGKLAKDKFWRNYHNKKDKTEDSILVYMNEYINRFDDKSPAAKDLFYSQIIHMLFEKKQWKKAFEYEKLISNKIQIAYTYDHSAFRLAGKDLDKQGTDLSIAKLLSKKSLDYVNMLLNEKVADDSDREELLNAKSMFADTYSFVLYKLGNYDSAFYYLNSVYEEGREFSTGSLERYAAYAQKAKGEQFAKTFIEKHLLEGIKSAVMLEQLNSIYTKTGLPSDEFEKLQQQSNLLIKQKTQEKIKNKYGEIRASDFALLNLAGETVTLSSLKGKVVVLDFWATWCGPCKAAFPTMQKLVERYKNDSSVVFLFVNVWEKKEISKMQIAAAKLLQDNNYSFNVLFDVNEKVVKDYKVEGIPTKIIIDKNGNIVFADDGPGTVSGIEDPVGEMASLIEAAK